MYLIKWFLCFYFLFILLIHKSCGIYSIQCCTGDDNTCSSKPVVCPSNVCFKLVINKVSEERGCLDDLINLLDIGNEDSRTLSERNRLNIASSTDQCQKLTTYGNGMSLCKCTTHLCNSSLKQIHLSFKLLLFILFLVHTFLHVFLS